MKLRTLPLSLVLLATAAAAAPPMAKPSASPEPAPEIVEQHQTTLNAIETAIGRVKTTDLGGGSTLEVIAAPDVLGGSIWVRVDYGFDRADPGAMLLGWAAGKTKELAIAGRLPRGTTAVRGHGNLGWYQVQLGATDVPLLVSKLPTILTEIAAASAPAPLIKRAIAETTSSLHGGDPNLPIDNGVAMRLYTDVPASRTARVSELVGLARALRPAAIGKLLKARAGHVRIIVTAKLTPQQVAKVEAAARTAFRDWELRGPHPAPIPTLATKREGNVEEKLEANAAPFAIMAQVYELPDERAAQTLHLGLNSSGPLGSRLDARSMAAGATSSFSIYAERTGRRVELQITVRVKTPAELAAALGLVRDDIQALRASGPTAKEHMNALSMALHRVEPLNSWKGPTIEAMTLGPPLDELAKLASSLVSIRGAMVRDVLKRHVDPDRMLTIVYSP